MINLCPPLFYIASVHFAQVIKIHRKIHQVHTIRFHRTIRVLRIVRSSTFPRWIALLRFLCHGTGFFIILSSSRNHILDFLLCPVTTSSIYSVIVRLRSRELPCWSVLPLVLLHPISMDNDWM